MNSSETEGKQIDLDDKEAAALAFEAIQNGDPDSFILLMEGIKEKVNSNEVYGLVLRAIAEIMPYTTYYSDLRDDYLRILLRKFRQQWPVRRVREKRRDESAASDDD